MSNRTLTFLLTLVIFAMGMIFALNFIDLYWDTSPKKFLSHNEVKGMAIEHDGQLFTLNFDQQNQVTDIFNRSIKVGYESYFETKEVSFDYDKLIIYRIDQPDIEMAPVTFINQQLLFRLPEWNPDGLIRETGPGELHTLLSQTYDP